MEKEEKELNERKAQMEKGEKEFKKKVKEWEERLGKREKEN